MHVICIQSHGGEKIGSAVVFNGYPALEIIFLHEFPEARKVKNALARLPEPTVTVLLDLNVGTVSYVVSKIRVCSILEMETAHPLMIVIIEL